MLEPLGHRRSTTLSGGPPASGASGPLTDLLALGAELLQAPTLVSGRAPSSQGHHGRPSRGLAGVLPWLRQPGTPTTGAGESSSATDKRPHWTGTLQHAQATFGHFGRSGSFLWVDPVQPEFVLAALWTIAPFGPWAGEAPGQLISDAVVSACGDP